MSVSSCRAFREQLIQYVADGEPAWSTYAALRVHLGQCPFCRHEAGLLRHVEQALRTYPPVVPAPELTGRILRAVARERQTAQEEWHVLSWEVWVPAVAFMLALLIAFLALPPQLQVGVAPRLGAWAAETGPVVEWIASLQGMWGYTFFWAIWMGLFAMAAGLGVIVSLLHWDAENNQNLDRLEARLSDAATWLRSHGLRAR